jgi:hypothetical protein
MNNQGETVNRKIRCPKCDGTGKQKEFDICRHCWGHGELGGAPESGYGGGYVPRGPNEICPDCKGTGKDKNRPHYGPCTYCEETGEVLVVPAKVPCDECQRTGTKYVPDGAYPSGKPKVRSIKCPRCSGTGLRDGVVHRPAL